ncbi:MAG: hypothetical protein LBR74_07750 [Eubacterium sp.]|nr:hypothetical protein [Eubacterium sp.]
MEGYIKIHRKILDWEWYCDINTARLFIHLLLTVGFEETKYKGEIFPKGTLITTLEDLSRATKLTISEVRTALKHLKSTREIELTTTNKKSIINVLNYSVYQDSKKSKPQANSKQLTNGSQSINNLLANAQLYKNGIMEECKNGRNILKESSSQIANTSFVPPSLDEIEKYCMERKNNIDPKSFFDYFQESGWIDSRGNSVKNWKQKIITWEKNSVPSKCTSKQLDTNSFLEMLKRERKNNG